MTTDADDAGYARDNDDRKTPLKLKFAEYISGK